MDQLELLRHAAETHESLRVAYAIVGSWGSGIYGEPRFTGDIDIVLDLPPQAISEFCKAFPANEFYVSADAVRDAVRTRLQFNVIHPASGNKVDFILPRADAWSAGQLARRRPVTIGSSDAPFTGFVAAPEDVIIGKLWYYSEAGGDRHLRDIAGMLRVSGDAIDRAEVERWARELGYLDVWQEIVAKADAPDAPPGPGSP
jgi:hypothetical protein